MDKKDPHRAPDRPAWAPPEPPMLALPSPDERPLGCFWRPNKAFIDELAEALRGRKVLEVFAGNGLMAAHLAARGVDIVATSERSGHDAHQHGLYHPVERLGAVLAATLYADSRDALLMCWPTVTPAALAACEAFGAGRMVAYVGEATDYAKNHLGGCADDLFFERFIPQSELSSYKGNCMERAWIGSISPAPRPALRRRGR